MRAKFADLGLEAIGNSPDEFAAVIKSEIPTGAKMIKESGIKPDWHASPEAAKLTRSTILTQRRRSMRAIVRAARALALALTCFAAPSFAAYPERPVTLIGVVNADPAGVNVRADAPYKSLKDLLAAVKANPGKFKASGTGQGGIWHLALAGLLKDQGMDPAAVPWVPSNGAAPGLQDLVSGGVEVVPCSIPEARSLIDAGKVRALAIMDANPPALYPNLPTLKQELGSNWSMAAWRAIAAPKGLPHDIQARLVAALKKVHESKEFRDFMAARGYGVIWYGSDDGVRFVSKSDADLGAVMKATGIAK